MVQESVDRIQHPQKYAAVASHVELADPFAAPKKNLFEQSVSGTFLEVDAERGLAKVSGDGTSQSCGKLAFKAGDYPLLSDGSLIDSPEKVRQFLAECATSNQPRVIRGDGQIVTLQ
jgi:hypothetical protein